MAALELTTNKNSAPRIGAQFFFITMLRQHSQYVGFSFRVLASVRLGLVLGLWVRVWVMVRPVRRTGNTAATWLGENILLSVHEHDMMLSYS